MKNVTAVNYLAHYFPFLNNEDITNVNTEKLNNNEKIFLELALFFVEPETYPMQLNRIYELDELAWIEVFLTAIEINVQQDKYFQKQTADIIDLPDPENNYNIY